MNTIYILILIAVVLAALCFRINELEQLIKTMNEAMDFQDDRLDDIESLIKTMNEAMDFQDDRLDDIESLLSEDDDDDDHEFDQ